MKIFWINLEKSLDRRKFMEKQFESLGYENYRFNAITPENLPKMEKDINKYKIFDNQYACLCSHILVLKQCLKYDDNWFCIMEDDMKINDNINLDDIIKKCPSDSEILQLFSSNYTYDRCDEMWIKWNNNWSTGIYLINKHAIKKILNKIMKESYLDFKNINCRPLADHLLYTLCNTYVSTYPFAIMSPKNLPTTMKFVKSEDGRINWVDKLTIILKKQLNLQDWLNLYKLNIH